MEQTELSGNAKRFSGFASEYDRYRPAPPAVLLEVLMQLARQDGPRLVVDLGCGTGLSTRVWRERAEQVIGIDPNADMLRQVRESASAANLSYRRGFSHETGLPEGGADIVTCSQSLHWMEPEGTFREAARILRPGGVFAAYDCDWPPTTPFWEVDVAYLELMAKARQLEDKLGASAEVKRWPKKEHLSRMQASGRFRFTKEIALLQPLEGSGGDLMGLVLSQASVIGLLQRGVTETELGLDRFRSVVHAALGDGTHPWYFTYRVRLGIA